MPLRIRQFTQGHVRTLLSASVARDTKYEVMPLAQCAGGPSMRFGQSGFERNGKTHINMPCMRWSHTCLCKWRDANQYSEHCLLTAPRVLRAKSVLCCLEDEGWDRTQLEHIREYSRRPSGMQVDERIVTVGHDNAQNVHSCAFHMSHIHTPRPSTQTTFRHACCW